MADAASSAGGNGERARSLLSPRQREAREWLAEKAAGGELRKLPVEEVLDLLARETGVVIPKTDAFVIMLTLQRLAADEALAQQSALAEAQAEVAAEMRLVLEQFRAAVKELAAPAAAQVRAPSGAKAPGAVRAGVGPNGEQVTDREYPGVKAGTAIASLVKAVLGYREQRDEARRELEKLKAEKGAGGR